jgi:hypothetical protein
MKALPKQIIEVAERLNDGQTPRHYKFRAVLKWFGAKRRGANIISDIKTAMASLNLEAQPPLDDAGLDDPIQFQLSHSSNSSSASSSTTTSPTSPDERVVSPNLATTDSQSSGATEAIMPSDDQLEPEPDDEQPVTRPDDRPVTSQSADWTISVIGAKRRASH